MSRNGSGVYSLPAGNPVVTLTQISSAWANATLTDIATELTNSIDKGGRTAPTANLPMAGYKHTGAGNAAAAGQYVTYNQTGLQFPALGIGAASSAWGAGWSAIDYGTASALVDSLSNGLFLLRNSYVDTNGDFLAKVTGAGACLRLNTVSATFQFAASATAGAEHTYTDVATMTSSGLEVEGTLAVTGAMSASNVLSGTYTPTVANQSNITSVSVQAAQYMRVGNVVAVSGECTITPASAAAATFSLSLPVAVTGVLGETHKVAGVCSVPGADIAPRVRGSGLAAPQVAWISDTYPGTSGDVSSYQFTYLLG